MCVKVVCVVSGVCVLVVCVRTLFVLSVMPCLVSGGTLVCDEVGFGQL